MQLMPGDRGAVRRRGRPFDRVPRTSPVGAHYLRWLLDRYDGRIWSWRWPATTPVKAPLTGHHGHPALLGRPVQYVVKVLDGVDRIGRTGHGAGQRGLGRPPGNYPAVRLAGAP